MIVVSVDPTQLPDGASSGQILITGSTGQTGTIPVTITIVPGQPRMALPQRGFLFTAVQGGGVTPPQTLSVLNTGNAAFSYTVTAIPMTGSGSGWLTAVSAAGTSSPSAFDSATISVNPAGLNPGVLPLGGSWLVALPDSGTLAPGASQTITVQTSTDSLAPGVYHGSVALQIGAVPREVEVLLVVAPGTQAVSFLGDDAAPACTPTALYPVFTSFIQDFAVAANWPLPVEVNVVDDCGNPMTSGRVVTSFSNGDAPITLSSLNNGRWQGTWFGRVVRSNQIVISAAANMDAPKLAGTIAYTGTLQNNTGVPSVNPNGVTIGAVSTAQAPLSLGSVISISGINLALSKNPALQLPLATALSGTQVLLGGELLPLLYTSAGLINAIVPYDLGVNAQYQVVVSSGGAISGPQTVTVAAAQPSIFKIDNTGSAQVAQDVWNSITNGTAPTAATAAPSGAIGAGDSLVIYCTGLGAVNQTVDPTAPAPGSVATASPVTVSVGGQSATPSFAGLVPGYTGLYEVNVAVPSGVPSGGTARVIVSVAGQSSAPISVSMR
jgi:uncharacterized protein (TIGR03437 family)